MHSNSFFSELIIYENQSFLSQQLRENDMAANVKQASERDNNNSESFISYQAKDPDLDANTILTKKKRKQKKKIIQKLIFQKAVDSDVSTIK